MGGRGASSGRSGGKPYGSEFRTLLQSGNIKFVQYNGSMSAKAPQETMTHGRVYVTVNAAGTLKHITYYDTKNKRTKQIDLDRPHDKVSPHTHHGYIHSEKDGAKGYAKLTSKEREMVERVKKIWYNRHNK
ncbi:hypothetical protein RX717_12770 [Intestinibacillus sp. NTUH-41-i26]|uniref:hypothetical protein n=1 Tax=Intestinibacillus sp. NTUH-41-i26 TaxID=3079303 RepID=UPI002934724E|nr:hypothetical protein [Intestinibacillus sp. NTUH-41-i26]WOC74842.1 hypothetical protein RX717_12770 [Intestinibacillus sp. NTUH-41-i26]